MLKAINHAFARRIPPHLLVLASMLLSGLHCRPAVAQDRVVDAPSLDVGIGSSSQPDDPPSGHSDGICRVCQIIAAPYAASSDGLIEAPPVARVRSTALALSTPPSRSILRVRARGPPNP